MESSLVDLGENWALGEFDFNVYKEIPSEVCAFKWSHLKIITVNSYFLYLLMKIVIICA